MRALRLRLPELLLIELDKFEDPRGSFMVTWEKQRLAECGIRAEFVQDNQSRSHQWTLRGLHYQLKRAQGKLVRVLAGRVYDVAVDVRRSSPSFGQWVGTELSAVAPAQLWIPAGFAHGFLALESNTEVLYKTTDVWAPEWERTVAWNDPALGINWPIPDGIEPLLSANDSAAGVLSKTETYP